ncbi:hypothetical protein HYZ80_02215 [Candidatus Parcubacteria bacterium]|nr:hypothetical protein [Candidatus Parcubacteria bacterium]
MHTDKSNWLLLALLVLVWFGIASVVPQPAPSVRDSGEPATAPRALQTETEAEVVVDFGNGERRAFSGPVGPETTALDVMAFVAAAGSLELELAGQDEMVLVQVGEFRTNTQSQWEVWLNDRGPIQNLQRTSIRPGDRLNLRFQ